MAKIKGKKVWFRPVVGADVVSYNVWAAKQGTVFNYDQPVVNVLATVPTVIVDNAPAILVDIPGAFPAGTFALDQVYSVWVTAVDDQGNESDPLVLSSPFDFVAPPAPVAGGVLDV